MSKPVFTPEELRDFMNDPMTDVIGTMAMAEKPVDWANYSPTVQLAWRTGYQNALSDLIEALYPGKPGGKRQTIAEIQAEDDRRRQRGTFHD